MGAIGIAKIVMELVVGFNFGILVGVMVGVLTLAACSKGPSSEQEAATGDQGMSDSRSDVSSVLADNSPSAETVECLAGGLQYTNEQLDEFIRQPRQSIAASIPAGQLLYWGAEMEVGNTGGGGCVAKLSQEDRERVKDNHYEASILIDKATADLKNTVTKEFFANPFGVFNALVNYRKSQVVTFHPGPKGDFEKTADYDSRIAAEKVAFDRVNNGKKVSIQDIEYMWMIQFGSPRLNRAGLIIDADLYDPDTETLSLTIVPKGYSSKQKEVGGDAPETGEWYTHYPFEIPLKIKLTPEQAQKFFQEFSTGNISDLKPVVAMQVKNGVLIVREVSLKDSVTIVDRFKSMGFKLDHIPVDYELSRNFVPNL